MKNEINFALSSKKKKGIADLSNLTIIADTYLLVAFGLNHINHI